MEVDQKNMTLDELVKRDQENAKRARGARGRGGFRGRGSFRGRGDRKEEQNQKRPIGNQRRRFLEQQGERRDVLMKAKRTGNMIGKKERDSRVNENPEQRRP
jgi:hypothetical protein